MRTRQVRHSIVISPMLAGVNSETGEFDDIDVEDSYTGRTATSVNERTIEIVLDIPTDFFAPIQIKGELKTRLEDIFTEFIEEHDDRTA